MLAVIFLLVSVEASTSGFPKSSSCAIALYVVPKSIPIILLIFNFPIHILELQHFLKI